jgi:alanyl-tRNA synthetase
MITAKELREKYLEFFKKRGHAVIPSASLIPENDPTTLFTGSGMQPTLPYLLGEKHPLGNRICDSQKCFRTQDIEEVGDNRHTTFFEMLGNWSFGDYFKKEQISWIFEFITKILGLDPSRIYVSVFRGREDLGIPRDDEAVKYWKEAFQGAGIEAVDIDFAEDKGMKNGRIFYYPDTKNWWSRVGVPENMPVGEPGGPDSEMFWDFGADLRFHENSSLKNQPCHINCECGRFLEIGNSVFMSHLRTSAGFELLPKKNIDFGGGLERMAVAVNDDSDIFLIDVFKPIIELVEKLSNKKYNESEDVTKSFRVIADHLRAVVFLINDGALPSNKDQGYFTRRLIRRAVRFAHKLKIKNLFTSKIGEQIINFYADHYADLKNNREKILVEINTEEEKFRKTLLKGLKEFEKFKTVDGKIAFNLYQTYGFPIELTEELSREKDLEIDKKVFKEEFKKHQELSRTASVGMFKGGLADASEQTTKYHTATHLLLAALREILGPDLPAQAGIYQKGSNITVERLRFDFNYPQKLNKEQVKKVEDLVNQKIKEGIAVEMVEMPKDEALRVAKVSFDSAKYGDTVKVYKIDDFSIELCGGPHVKNTRELGKFKIVKEEASSAGVRRIKATLE